VKKSIILLFILCLNLNFALLGQNLNLKIYGNDAFQDRVIDSIGYLKIHENYNSLSLETHVLQKKLFRIGYIENSVSEIEKENDTAFSVKMNLKKKYNTISIYYNKKDIAPNIINDITKEEDSGYFKIPINAVERTLQYINGALSKKGYPFSKIKLSNISIDDDAVLKANLISYTEKQQRFINKIKIKGYEKFSQSFVKYYLKIKPNQTFDKNTINKKAALLNNLKFAKQIKSPEVLFTSDSTELYFYIEKSKSNYFDGFLGFGTNEANNKIQFNGYLNLRLINNLHYGESLNIEYKSTQNDQKLFNATVNVPYFLKTPVGIDLQLDIFKQDSSFTNVNQSIKLNYQVNSNHKLFGGLKYTESNNLLNSDDFNAISDYKSNYITFAYEYLKPQYDNQLFPINTNLFLESGFGARESSSFNEKQTQLLAEASKIFNLNEKNSIYLRINGASLISNTYFENELFRFGGINSVRGFQENSILATTYGFLNTEYRLQLSPTIYIHSIIDLASFQNKITDINEKLFAYGFGMGILSNAGLLKLNYANGKTNNQTFKFSNSQIHISFQANF
jgi:outer membrane protein assembly factor BamA